MRNVVFCVKQGLQYTPQPANLQINQRVPRRDSGCAHTSGYGGETAEFVLPTQQDEGKGVLPSFIGGCGVGDGEQHLAAGMGGFAVFAGDAAVFVQLRIVLIIGKDEHGGVAHASMQVGGKNALKLTPDELINGYQPAKLIWHGVTEYPLPEGQ